MAKTTGKASLVPLPVDRYPDVGPPFAEAPDGYIDLYGHCSHICTQDPTGDGLTVDGHGPWCTSPPLAYATVGQDNNAERWSVWVELAEPYFHGRYVAEDVHSLCDGGGREPLVRLVLDAEGVTCDPDFDARYLYLKAAEARRLAAILTYAADVADGLTSGPKGLAAVSP